MRTLIKRGGQSSGLLALAVVLGGLFGTTVFAAEGPTEPDDTHLQPASGTYVLDGKSSDPVGAAKHKAIGAPSEASWGVRIYRSETGLTCAEAGIRTDAAFGRLRNGKFAVSPEGQPTGLCADIQQSGGVLTGFSRQGEDVNATRSVLYGVAGKTVSQIYADGIDVPIGSRGGFVKAYDGEHGFADVKVTYVYKDGTKKSLPDK